MLGGLATLGIWLFLTEFIAFTEGAIEVEAVVVKKWKTQSVSGRGHGSTHYVLLLDAPAPDGRTVRAEVRVRRQQDAGLEPGEVHVVLMNPDDIEDLRNPRGTFNIRVLLALAGAARLRPREALEGLSRARQCIRGGGPFVQTAP